VVKVLKQCQAGTKTIYVGLIDIIGEESKWGNFQVFMPFFSSETEIYYKISIRQICTQRMLLNRCNTQFPPFPGSHTPSLLLSHINQQGGLLSAKMLHPTTHQLFLQGSPTMEISAPGDSPHGFPSPSRRELLTASSHCFLMTEGIFFVYLPMSYLMQLRTHTS